MGLPFLNNRSARTDQIIAIDLGTRTTKAVYLQRQENRLVLLNYVVQETPASETKISRDAWSEHLRAIARQINARTKKVVLVVGVSDSLICHADLPAVELSDMRKMVRLNAKSYFQQDLPDYSFDCHPLGSPAETIGGKSSPRLKTIVGAASNSFLAELEGAALDAGLVVEEVTLGHLGPTNAFLSLPQEPHKGAVALVDIGFTNSTVSILYNGELRFTRVVNIGADMVTSGLAEALNITYPVAEGLKQIMPDKVQSKLQTLLAPLARELRTSIDFFEHQQEKTVSELYVSGGSVRSASIVDMLQADLNLPCQSWDPTHGLVLEMPAAQAAKVKADAPQLATAISAALGVLELGRVRLNLLAEQRETEEMRRRDPVKLAYLVGALAFVLILIWGSYLRITAIEADAAVDRRMATLKTLQQQSSQVAADAKRAGELERALLALQQLQTNRFDWAPAFEALKHTVVDDVQVVRIKTEQTVTFVPSLRPVTNSAGVTPGRKAITTEKNTISIQAKDFADPPAAEKFMDTIKRYPWFQQNLRRTEPIRLKDRSAPQADPTDPAKTFILFTVECYSERNL